MAIRIPIITDLQDKGIKDAQKAFGDFKLAVNNAEGGLGKFKAGSTAIFDAVKANAVTFGLAAGAALFTFAKAGVDAFQKLAIESGKFADATGLAVDQASRWVEVSGDIGIETGTVETAIGKMNKVLGTSPGLFKELGVEVATTKDGTKDANETFLNVIDRLQKIKDPAEKARVATQLLGKGWQSMAELINQGSSTLRNSLADVSESKVIDAEELAKAKEYRDTMDALKGKFEDISLALGQELVPLLTDAASWLEKISSYEIGENSTLGWIFKLGKWNIDRTLYPFKKIGEAVEAIAGSGKDAEVLPETMRSAADETDRFNRAALNQIPQITNTFEKLAGQVKKTADEYSADTWERFYEDQKQIIDVINPDKIDNFRLKLDDLAGVMSADTWERFMTDLDDPIVRILPDRLDKVRVATQRVYYELKNASDAWDILTGNLNEEVALDDAKIALEELQIAANNAFGSGSQKLIDEYDIKAAEFADQLSKIAGEMDNISSKQILFKFKTEGPAAALEYARYLARGAEYGGLSQYDALTLAGISGGLQFRASGGPVMSGGSYIVGEKGPELFTPGSSGSITPNNALGGANITVNVNGGDPNSIVRALQQYVRQSGPVPVNTRTM
jgi:hypothetical protein